MNRIYDLLPQSAGSELARDLYYDTVLPGREQSSSPDSDQPFEQPLQTSTHALHLAPEGYILPHVDNVDASGTVIIGVSLGAERILRLEEAEQEGRKVNIVHRGWDVLLKTGSLYLQKYVGSGDSIRLVATTDGIAHLRLSHTETASDTTMHIRSYRMVRNLFGMDHRSSRATASV